MITRRLLTSTTLYAVLSLSIIAFLPARSAAWGAKGHQTIARIAMDRLSKNARQSVAGLLNPGETLETVSTWADLMKLKRKDTTTWHFVEISLKYGDYDRSRDCKKGTCIIDAIENQIGILKNTRNGTVERADALKYLVHLIGDLHQPFHVTTNEDPPDAGASRVRVTFLNGPPTSLRKVWDDDLINYTLKRSNLSVAQYAAELGGRGRMTQSGYTSTQGSVRDWALETHRLAWRAYYLGKDFMYVNPTTWPIDETYYKQNRAVAENQLFLAGIRLAKTLNDIFG
ncbi:MAG: S1/P1 nuclease [Acidobacteriota bacterium]